MIHTVIIAGGKGERFWPFSTKEKPKQLLHVYSDRSMLQDTIERVSELAPMKQTLIVTGESIKNQILQHIPYIKDENVLAEPFGKNTCLAVAFAATHLLKSDPTATMVVLSADHFIQPKERLLELLRCGVSIAQRDDVLITIGINPTRPETGYGYIEQGDIYDTFDGITTFVVKQFKEKPSRPLAQQYYVGRSHLWNSGMFVWTANSFMKAVAKCRPQMHAQLMEYQTKIGTSEEMEARLKLFEEAENISVDVAILEAASNVLVIRGDLIWDDIGSWLALERINAKDKDNNVTIGETVLHDSYEITAVNAGGGIIATLGVSDLVIVKTDRVVLVAHKTKVAEIKSLLARLKEDERLEQYL
jgi:mannose-1-phosphate guanylyltransferase